LIRMGRRLEAMSLLLHSTRYMAGRGDGLNAAASSTMKCTGMGHAACRVEEVMCRYDVCGISLELV
jgi:hypothetical protein